MKNYNFDQNLKLANLVSIILVIGSFIFNFFKGLNFGIDFKGGTLIELRVESNKFQYQM